MWVRTLSSVIVVMDWIVGGIVIIDSSSHSIKVKIGSYLKLCKQNAS